MCGICKGDPARRQEVDALLDGDEHSHSEIGVIVGVKKWEIQRYASHRPTASENARPGQPQSLLHQLYAKLEKQADKMLKRGGELNTRHGVTLLSKLVGLRKQLEAAEANEAANKQATPKESPWCNSLAHELGYTSRGLDRELCRDLAMFIRRHADLNPAIEAASSFLIANLNDTDKPELAETLAPIIEKFLLELKPHLEKVANETRLLEETDYSRVDVFGG